MAEMLRNRVCKFAGIRPRKVLSDEAKRNDELIHKSSYFWAAAEDKWGCLIAIYFSKPSFRKNKPRGVRKNILDHIGSYRSAHEY